MTELEKSVLKKVKRMGVVDWLSTKPQETAALNRLVEQGVLRFEPSTKYSKGQWVLA